jgi:hypothetical protein
MGLAAIACVERPRGADEFLRASMLAFSELTAR